MSSSIEITTAETSVKWGILEALGAASSSHTHAIANVTNLQTTLDGKASTVHTHAMAEVIGHSVTETYASTVTTVASSLPNIAEVKMTLTGNLTINAPTGPKTPQRISYVLTASGAGRTLTLHSSIKVPSGFTFSGTILSGNVRLLTIHYCGASVGWCVVENFTFAP